MPETDLSEGMLLEPEEILNRLALNPSEQIQRLQNLEILARAYQSLTSDRRHPEQLTNVEQQILLLLGLSVTKGLLGTIEKTEFTTSRENVIHRDLTIARSVAILEALEKCASIYLGPKISRDYFIASCPASLQRNGFAFGEDRKLKVSRAMKDTLEGKEAEDFKTWIKLYINRCSTIIHGFDALVNQEHLAYCSITRQEIQLSQ